MNIEYQFYFRFIYREYMYIQMKQLPFPILTLLCLLRNFSLMKASLLASSAAAA